MHMLAPIIRTLLYLLIISATWGCESSKKGELSFTDYQYPKDNLNQPKIFTFHRIDNIEIKKNVVHRVYEKEDTTYFVKYTSKKKKGFIYI